MKKCIKCQKTEEVVKIKVIMPDTFDTIFLNPLPAFVCMSCIDELEKMGVTIKIKDNNEVQKVRP